MKKPNPIIAFLFSFFIPGLGQLYVGKLKVGIAIVCFHFSLALLIALAYGFGFISYEWMRNLGISAGTLLPLAYGIHATLKINLQEAIHLTKYRNVRYYLIYVFVYFGLGSSAKFLSNEIFVYPFQNLNSSMPVAAPKGSCVMVRRPLGNHPNLGDLVVWKHEGYFFVSKVTGIPGSSSPIQLSNDQYYLAAEGPGHTDSATVGPVSPDEIVGIVADVIIPYFSEGLVSKINLLHCIGNRL